MMVFNLYCFNVIINLNFCLIQIVTETTKNEPHIHTLRIFIDKALKITYIHIFKIRYLVKLDFVINFTKISND